MVLLLSFDSSLRTYKDWTTVKKLLVVADALSEEWAWLSWDERARAHDAIATLGEHETVITPWEARYVLPVDDDDIQNVDLVIVHLSTIWVQGSELTSASLETATEWVKDLFTRIVVSNRNAEVLTIVDSESDVKHQRQELLRILLLREFDVQV